MGFLAGQMMQRPLLISDLITHAARYYGDVEIVSRRVEGDIHRYTWQAAEERARQLAQALARLGVEPGDRVGTLAWNGYRHLEIYYAVSGSGAVCHTINPRLFANQIAWIINHAEDKVLCFDLNCLALVEQLQAELITVQKFVVMTDRAHFPAHTTLPNLLCFEDLIAAENGQYDWPSFDEATASGLCYTSGTTGHPKGVLYSHRSTVLHALAIALPDALKLSACDTVLPIVPMFHVNAWGIPYTAAMVGCKLVFAGAQLDGAAVYELIEQEAVNITAGVPTVWQGLLQYMEQNHLQFQTLQTVIVGGAACPPSMSRLFEDKYHVQVVHAWGMTEISPLGTVGRLKAKHRHYPLEEQRRLRDKQGKPIFGINLRIVDDQQQELPWDSQTAGHLQVQGHWVMNQYFHTQPLTQPMATEWFTTGDVATLDADGYMQITDRSKDVIKSGGEWISSIELENIAVAHPAIAQAAVIGVAHPKWDERPLLLVVAKPNTELVKEAVLQWFGGKIPKWQVPDDVIFIAELPYTATGKINKLLLREKFQHHRWA